MNRLDIYEIRDEAAIQRNRSRHDYGSAPECLACGRPIKNKSTAKFVWVHDGGGTIVDHEEGERLNREGHGASDCGGHPIGPECYKKYRVKLAPFVSEGLPD